MPGWANAGCVHPAQGFCEQTGQLLLRNHPGARGKCESHVSRRCSCSTCAFFKPQSVYELEKGDLWSQESLEMLQPIMCSL